MARPRLLLADDHPMVLDGLRKLLEPEFEVIAAVTDGRALVAAAEQRRPDLVIADISMDGIDGVEVTRRLRATAPAVRVVILSVHAEPSWVRAAFDAGARGYLTKSSVAEEIELAVREVLEGRFYVSPRVARAAILRDPDGPPERRARSNRGAPPAAADGLTPRERDVVRLVGRGLGNKEIAFRLGVSVTTVRTHLRCVYDKLGLAGRVGLALHAAPRLGPGRPPAETAARPLE
jgi:DNA-binding NarL/FixJ family response regulator